MAAACIASGKRAAICCHELPVCSRASARGMNSRSSTSSRRRDCKGFAEVDTLSASVVRAAKRSGSGDAAKTRQLIEQATRKLAATQPGSVQSRLRLKDRRTGATVSLRVARKHRMHCHFFLWEKSRSHRFHDRHPLTDLRSVGLQDGFDEDEHGNETDWNRLGVKDSEASAGNLRPTTPNAAWLSSGQQPDGTKWTQNQIL